MVESAHTRFKINNFIIDCHNMTISNGDKSVKLPAKVFDYLRLFLVNENHIVVHEDAINKIWNGNEGVGKRGYINAMWQIRKAFTDLGADCDKLFKTLPKVGYVLTITPEPLLPLTASDKAEWPQLIKITSFLGVIAIMVVASLDRYSDVEREKGQMDETVKFITPTSVTNFQGVEEHPAISNNGKLLAFQWLQENRYSGIYIKELDNPNSPLRLVSTGKYQETLPVWSPDDTALAYIRIDDKKQCQIRVKQLLTLQDRLIDTGCSYLEFKKVLDWSPDGRMLLYSKRINGTVAFFKYDFITEISTQASFPEKGMGDLMAIWSSDSQDIILLREKAQQYKLVLLMQSGQEKPLLDYKESITGLARGKGKQIFVNLSENGRIGTYQLNFTNSDNPNIIKINKISGASNLNFNKEKNELLVSKHQSSEYIIQREFDSEHIIRRVFSSNRDLYGQYISGSENIVFISNRSSNWDLWIQNNQSARNLTNGIGAVNFASISPDGMHFAFAIAKKGESQQHLFIGNINTGHLTKVDTGDLIPAFPTWSKAGTSIYFSAIMNNHNGLYQYDISKSELTQLTSSDEIYAIPAGEHELFVSRTNENGIWRFNIKSNQFTKVVSNLSTEDFGSFFTQNNSLYYVVRTPEVDTIKKYNETEKDYTVASYPPNSIRKYFGISKADNTSFIVTLNSIYDADILSFPVKN